MYFVTAATFDWLTLNTPYPVCHANFESHFSCTQRDEFAFNTRAICAEEWAGRIRTNMCTWSAVPLTMSAAPSISRMIPPRYANRSARKCDLIRGRRPCVEKIMCSKILPDVWDTILSPLRGLGIFLAPPPTACAVGCI